MSVNSLTIKFVYGEDSTVANYQFNSESKTLVVKIGDKSVVVKNMDKEDFNDISCEIANIMPDEINDLGASISMLENFIFVGFIENDSNLSLINNSVFIVEYTTDEETEETEENVYMKLSSNKIIKFPTTGSEYFNKTLKDLL